MEPTGQTMAQVRAVIVPLSLMQDRRPQKLRLPLPERSQPDKEGRKMVYHLTHLMPKRLLQQTTGFLPP